jgi:hypothetical protein
MKLKELQIKLKDLTDQVNTIPCLLIDGLPAMSIDTDSHWKTNVLTIFNINHIYKSWIVDMVNPSEHTHPNTVIIKFINNIVRNHAYRILSQYVIDNEYDTIISKDDTIID